LLYLLNQIYGDDEDMLKGKLLRLRGSCDLFLKLYGDGAVSVLRAPARINILGEHVDYVSYLPTASLPFGSREHDMIMLYRASQNDQVRGASTFDVYPAFDFELSEGPPSSESDDAQREWVTYLYDKPMPTPHWENYVKGAVFFARLKYGKRAQHGFDFVVDSSIPPGGGASSSSALTVLAGTAIREVNEIQYARDELARDSSQAEWYGGTRGGAMDQMTICLAQRHNAVHISYADMHTDLVPLPDQQFRWTTFFSHEADKGQNVMLEYNERSAVSRIIIPAIIEHWRHNRPELYGLFEKALEEFRANSLSALDSLRQTLQELPEEITLAEVEREYRDAFRQCSLAFPALVRERREQALKVRDRALHHLGEVKRVTSALRILRDMSHAEIAEGREVAHAGMRAIGELLDESHESLCVLYEVCTPEVDRLVEVIASDPQVYGARLMGGGFGGNVLALTTAEHLSSLIDRVQSGYYGPQGREGQSEGAIMVSTPGAGLSAIDADTVSRQAITEFNTVWWEADRYREAISSMIDDLDLRAPAAGVWPIIVAAGKGVRAASSGLNVPKPLALISGIPAVQRVLSTIKAAGVCLHDPIVIVSPETEQGIREALAGEKVSFVVQPIARGTGDAVLFAYEQMRGFEGRALVVWGTQPALRARTIRRVLKLAEIFSDYQMVLPTATVHHPYAPLLRDHLGQVHGSRETHLEKAASIRFGETNAGLFLVKSEIMFEALLALKSASWREREGRYDRPGGELGFPSELINYLSRQEGGVLASPIADWREKQGIKELADVAKCEQFIAELEDET
jgi:galactokinase